ncbi:hypothetical protein G9A89_020711 [Geosiphon pyriformis]|nr:hypothetical protein G9A89_020711 [Geosiphon pyriformis]
MPPSSTNIVFRHQITASLAANLTIGLIKHLLFMRGQIPCLFSQIEKLSQISFMNHQQKKLSQKKITELITNSKDLFFTIKNTFIHILEDQIFLSNLSLTIILGNTATNPKEIYLLKFKNIYVDWLVKLDEDFYVKQQEQYEIMSERKLIRELVEVLNEKALVPTRLHILFRASRENPPPKLIPKQLFKLNTKTPTRIITCKGLYKELEQWIGEFTDKIQENNSITVETQYDFKDSRQSEQSIDPKPDDIQYHIRNEFNESQQKHQKLSEMMLHVNILAEATSMTRATIDAPAEGQRKKISITKSYAMRQKKPQICGIEGAIGPEEFDKNVPKTNEEKGKLMDETDAQDFSDDFIWYCCKNILIGFPAA